jgi:muconolactone delta-isomerase
MFPDRRTKIRRTISPVGRTRLQVIWELGAKILNSLPLYPFMEVEIAALCHHPASLELTK